MSPTAGPFRTLPENPVEEPFDGVDGPVPTSAKGKRGGKPPKAASPEDEVFTASAAPPRKPTAAAVPKPPAPTPEPPASTPVPEPPPARAEEELPPAPSETAPRTGLTSPPTNGAAGGRSVCILLPQYKSTNPLTFTSVLGLRHPERNAAVLNFGDAFIVHTRNQLAHAFMTQTRSEWALFVDDDMVLPFGNAGWFEHSTGFRHIPRSLQGLHTIDRLLASKKTLVGGLYFSRHPNNRRAVFAEGHAPGPYSGNNFDTLPQDRVVRTRWVGTGCLLVNRSVFVDIQSRFPHLAPARPGEPWQYFSACPDRLHATVASFLESKASREDLIRALSDAQRENLGKGEDVLFCERAELAGHPAHVDLGLLCGHVGHAVY